MKSVVFGASLAAAVFAASCAMADVVLVANESYSTSAEALRNAPPPPQECLDAAGANTCFATFVDEIGPTGLQWRFGWTTPGTLFICLDAAAEYQVDCDAPDAVPVVPPQTCVRVPGGTPNCSAMPSPLPYRPTPKS